MFAEARWTNRSRFLLQAIVASSKEKGAIWIPSYFCEEALQALRLEKNQIVFYPVDENLYPDWNWCWDNARAHAPQWFLLCHHFGIANQTSAAKEFCASVGCRLIEDCAHLPGPVKTIKREGEFAFYSLYKWHGGASGSVLYRMFSADQGVAQNSVSTPLVHFSDIGDLFRGLLSQKMKQSLRKILFADPTPGSFQQDPPLILKDERSLSSLRMWYLKACLKRRRKNNFSASPAIARVA